MAFLVKYERLVWFFWGLLSAMVGGLAWLHGLSINPHCGWPMPFVLPLIVLYKCSVWAAAALALLGLLTGLERSLSSQPILHFRPMHFAGGAGTAFAADLLWLFVAIPHCPFLTR